MYELIYSEINLMLSPLNFSNVNFSVRRDVRKEDGSENITSENLIQPL